MNRRIFVFGSNDQGRHIAGAAAFAATHYGAEAGVSEGLTGDCYALPTCEWLGRELRAFPLNRIQLHANTFMEFARANPDMDFLLTAVGCGIAGYATRQVADLFRDCPDNVYIQARLAYGL